MAPRSSYFSLADQLYDGKLRDQLIGWREANLSFDDIALQLRDRQVTVTGETVRQWCLTLGIHSPERSAS